MAGFRAITPGINVNTSSGQLRTELLNTFSRLDGQLAQAPYQLTYTNGPVLSSGAAETTLLSAGIDVGTLAKAGSSILIFAAGTTAANGNNKTINLYFGSTQIFTSGAYAGNDTSWTLQAEIVRNGATAQITWAQFFASATLTSKIQVGTASVNLAVAQTISLKAQGTATGDISASFWKLTLLT